MSQMTPPPNTTANQQFYQQAVPAPFSTPALVGFISSLLVCIPLITQLVGFILGIIGITQTSAGRKRGRGLAIASMVISPIVALAWVGIGILLIQLMGQMFTFSQDLQPLLAGDAAATTTAAAAVREATFSERLKVRVGDEELGEFARSVLATHGSLNRLVNAEELAESRPDGQGVIINLVGEFANGTTDVDLIIGFDGWTPKIDNMIVGDLELAPPQ